MKMFMSLKPIRVKMERVALGFIYKTWQLSPRLFTPIVVNLLSVAIPYITSNLEQRGDFKSAYRITSTKKITGKLPKESQRLIPRYLSKLNMRVELSEWFERHKHLASIEALDPHIMKLTKILLRVEEELGSRTLRRRMILRNVETLRESDYSQFPEREFNFLSSNRIFRALVEKILQKGQVSKWSHANKALKADLDCEPISDWIADASTNEMRNFDDQKAEIALHASKAQAIQILIPTHYFAMWDKKSGGARQQNWSTIKRMFNEFAAIAKSSDIQVYARHQYYLQSAAPSKTIPAISFFTSGGSLNHWHMRDIGLANYLSIDPDGYWGHSSVSQFDITEMLKALTVSETDIDDAVYEMQQFFEQSGGDKYNSKDTSSSREIEQQSIFAPLQSPSGLEATDQKVEDLIGLLTRYSRETGVKVYFRRHPLDQSEMVTKLLRRAAKIANCEETPISPWQLSKTCAATVTLNSATALQAIAAGRPVFTWGQTDINAVSTDIGDDATFRKNMNLILEGQSIGTGLSRRFVYWYLRRYLVDVRNPASVTSRLQLILRLSCLGDSETLRHAFLAAISAPQNAEILTDQTNEKRRDFAHEASRFAVTSHPSRGRQ